MSVYRRDDPLAVAVLLRPYQWRSFRPELLARSFLAAKDRQELAGVLAEVPGAAVGRWDDLEPASRDDVRVAGLVRFLASQRWTQLSLTALCEPLLDVLDIS